MSIDFLSWILLDVIVEIIGIFGVTMTYSEAGPILAFGMLLIPSLLFPFLFLRSEPTQSPSFLELHHRLLERSGIVDSKLAQSIRHMDKYQYLYSPPDVVEREIRFNMILIPFSFIFLVILASIWLIMPFDLVVEAALSVATLFALTLYVFIFGSPILKEHQSYKLWKKFWWNYWRAMIFMIAPIDRVKDIFFDSRLYGFNPKTDSTINKRLDRVLEYHSVDAKDIPQTWSDNEIIDLLTVYYDTTDYVKFNDALLKNNQVKSLLSNHLQIVNAHSTPWSIEDINGFVRSCAIIKGSLSLAEVSLEAFEDFMSLDISKFESSELSKLAFDHFYLVKSSPSVIIPKSFQWLLISYSLATTIAILLGPLFTQILLSARPPS
jgi:hypothetical protein